MILDDDDGGGDDEFVTVLQNTAPLVFEWKIDGQSQDRRYFEDMECVMKTALPDAKHVSLELICWECRIQLHLKMLTVT